MERLRFFQAYSKEQIAIIKPFCKKLLSLLIHLTNTSCFGINNSDRLQFQV